MEYITSVNLSIKSPSGPVGEVGIRYLLVLAIKELAAKLEQDRDTEFSWELVEEIEPEDLWNT